MIDRIEAFPTIPETLRLAAFQRKLVPFIGAGLSQIGGCPGWGDFANATLRFLVDKEKLSHAQLDQISTLPARVKFSVALELEKKHDISVDFKELLKPSSAKKSIGDKAYGNLSRLATTFVTTNYDDWLDRYLPPTFRADESSSSPIAADTTRNPLYKHTDMTIEKLDTPNAVFHIHGSINDRESMVLTTAHYLDHYASHRIDGRESYENPFLTFLETLFRLKTVLFIGYSLSELEVLEYVVQKGIKKRPDSNEEPSHYVLQGFFSHEIELARSLESYYRQFGIGLLPFSRDEHDWDQLVDVIDYLASELLPGPELALPKRIEMEELLS